MLKKVRDYMREHEMTAPGDAVIVALSGGADSVCLLTVLKQLATPELLAPSGPCPSRHPRSRGRPGRGICTGFV